MSLQRNHIITIVVALMLVGLGTTIGCAQEMISEDSIGASTDQSVAVASPEISSGSFEEAEHSSNPKPTSDVSAGDVCRAGRPDPYHPATSEVFNRLMTIALFFPGVILAIVSIAGGSKDGRRFLRRVLGWPPDTRDPWKALWLTLPLGSLMGAALFAQAALFVSIANLLFEFYDNPAVEISTIICSVCLFLVVSAVALVRVLIVIRDVPYRIDAKAGVGPHRPAP